MKYFILILFSFFMTSCGDTSADEVGMDDENQEMAMDDSGDSQEPAEDPVEEEMPAEEEETPAIAAASAAKTLTCTNPKGEVSTYTVLEYAEPSPCRHTSGMCRCELEVETAGAARPLANARNTANYCMNVLNQAENGVFTFPNGKRFSLQEDVCE